MPAAKTQPRRWQNRMRADATPVEQFANACDRLRSVAARMYRPRADRGVQERSALAARLATLEAAAAVGRIAAGLELTESEISGQGK